MMDGWPRLMLDKQVSRRDYPPLVLFILSVSAVFQWLGDKYSPLQTVLFVKNKGLVVECDTLEEGPSISSASPRDTVQWGSDNRVEFEVSKTEVLPSSRHRRIFRAATEVVVRVGEQSFAT